MDHETKQLLRSICEILRETTEAAFEGKIQSEKTHRALLDSPISAYKESYPAPSNDDSMPATLKRIDDLIQQLE